VSLSRLLALPVAKSSAPRSYRELASQGARPIWPVLFAGSSARHSGRNENEDGSKWRCPIPILPNWTVLRNRSILPPQTAPLGRRAKKMTYLERITFNPEQCGGRPCVRGMRIRVKDVLDLLAAGVSEHEILEDYPDLKADDIKACLQYAAAQADHAVLRVG
jgi:uncharacterized protein (DUF433 family)